MKTNKINQKKNDFPIQQFFRTTRSGKRVASFGGRANDKTFWKDGKAVCRRAESGEEVVV